MITSCPICNESLDVPDEFARREVRCGRCKSIFFPHPTEAIPTVRPIGPRFVLEPQPLNAARGAKNTAGLVLLAGFTVLLTTALVGCCVWGLVLFAYPEFSTTVNEEGRFTAVFPGTPEPTDRTADDGSPVHGLEYDRGFPMEKYFVFYEDLNPAQMGMEADAIFAEAILRLVREALFVDSSELARRSTQHDGYPALDLQLIALHRPREQMVVRLVLVGNRIYVAGVAGPLDSNQGRVRQFFQGFHVSKAAEKKPGKNPFLK